MCPPVHDVMGSAENLQSALISTNRHGEAVRIRFQTPMSPTWPPRRLSASNPAGLRFPTVIRHGTVGSAPVLVDTRVSGSHTVSAGVEIILNSTGVSLPSP